jgi:hypothetical protein
MERPGESPAFLLAVSTKAFRVGLPSMLAGNLTFNIDLNLVLTIISLIVSIIALRAAKRRR